MKSIKKILFIHIILIVSITFSKCEQSNNFNEDDLNDNLLEENQNNYLNSISYNSQQISANQTATTASLKILFWNINAGRNSDITTIANYIKSIDADVIGLNEVYLDQVTPIMDILGSTYQRNFHNLKINADFGNLTISKKTIEASATQRWTYSQNSNHECEGSGDNGNRQGLMKTKIDIGSGKFLFFYNTHLGRECQTTIQDSQISELKTWSDTHGGRKIIVGDFNLQPASAQHTAITTGGPSFEDPLESNFSFKTWKVGSSSHNKRIDYIMGNGWITINNIYAGTTTTSDHYPVIADVSVTL